MPAAAIKAASMEKARLIVLEGAHGSTQRMAALSVGRRGLFFYTKKARIVCWKAVIGQ
jgi:hypothetical protein